MFLHALAQRLIVFQDDELFVFDGSYQEFLEKGGWQDEATETKASRKKEVRSEPAPIKSEIGLNMTKKEIRQKRSEIMAEKAKVLKPIADRIKKLENAIESHEKEVERLNTDLKYFPNQYTPHKNSLKITLLIWSGCTLIWRKRRQNLMKK
ncbi:MAG: hypothetical protein JRJ27_22500 [Deltaproteobacteria bacterium]|nr:hypothetical protein [Deltaproteobacteria bacterium]